VPKPQKHTTTQEIKRAMTYGIAGRNPGEPFDAKYALKEAVGWGALKAAGTAALYKLRAPARAARVFPEMGELEMPLLGEAAFLDAGAMPVEAALPFLI
jgi:hypothetical protein